MKTYASFILRHKWQVLVGWVLVIVAMNALSGALGGAKYKDEFKLPHTETETVSTLLTRAHLEAQNGIDGTVVLHATSGSLAKPPSALVPALESLCASKYKVVSVESPWGAIACTGSHSFTPAGRNPLLLSQTDPSIALVTVSFDAGRGFDQKAVTATYDRLKTLRSSVLEVEFTGDVFEGSGQRQGTTVPETVGFLAALVILSIVFRTFGTVAVPLLSAVCALGLGQSLIALLSHAMNVSNVTPQLAQLMVIGVGVDYALFIITRHRRNLRNGMPVDESIILALNTSGRAVLFAGITVCIAMLGLIALGVSFFYGMAIGVSIAVSLTMVASMTLLPAILGLLGRRALPRSQREALPSDRRVKLLLCVIPPLCVVFWLLYALQFALRPVTTAFAGRRARATGRGFWWAWSDAVAANKTILGALASAVIVLLAIPFFSMRMGHADQGNDPKFTTTRKGYDLIAQGFGVGYNSTLTVVIEGPNATSTAERAAAAIRTTDGVEPTSVFALPKPPAPTVTFVFFKSTTSPQDARTTALVNRLRKHVLPPVAAGTGDRLYVYGRTAIYVDFTHVLSAKMPLFIGAVVIASFLLLLVAFRSLLVPATAAAMNLFAAAASFGLIVLIFQWGWGAEALGIGKGGPIEAFAPVLFFAILFGLSMDYQVFFVSRMHEEWVHTEDNRRSIVVGQAETGGIITAAAIIMIAVFGGFVLGDNRVVKLIGLGLAGAIFIDAFILRTVLVPSLMHVLGRANWYFPAWLDRITPQVSVEPHDEDLLASAVAGPVGDGVRGEGVDAVHGHDG